MKFIVSLILTALLSFAFGMYMPWWSVAFAAFIVAVLIPQTPGRSFLTGFIALFLLWGILTFYIDVQNEHILSQRVAELIIKSKSSFVMILLTALIGALVGGFAALSGSYLRKAGK
ncbi:MAG: hypothetical protein HYR66_00975 [Sphingobacteriales bacterium]|nr:hypothetical protein [Sphingobacteriales bacterium]MBI3719197.1 hypothetical protein [Sphingobacteriales bacterium]